MIYHLPRFWSFIVASCVTVAFCGDIVGQQARTVEVTGRAHVEAMPDSIEITARLSATGKTSRKALEHYQKKKGEFNTAVNPMNFAGIEVSFSNTNVAPTADVANAAMAVMMGGDEVEVEEDAKFTVDESVTILLHGLDKMEEDEVTAFVAKMNDVISENQGEFGEIKANPFGITGAQQKQLRFFISDPSTVIADSDAKAMKAARDSATRLAALADGNVGKVLSVKQTSASAAGDENAMESMMMEMYGLAEDVPEEFSSHTYGPIRVARGLNVTFELLD